jgi:iron complex outermembrane recepter protein
MPARKQWLRPGTTRILTVCLCLSLGNQAFAEDARAAQDPEVPEHSAAEAPQVDELVVWGKSSKLRSEPVGPVSTLTPVDFAAINIATTEDLVKFEPSLVIRRRFIGDANGTLGIRGSNMFQTSRSMVIADGVPLHYLLQSRWNGAPRWTLISASEIARVDVLYGPYSAEYSGNAMGGVVVIESAIPQQREFHFDSSVFTQSFDAYGYDGSLSGNRLFFSYGDRIGDLSLYASYNRLDNQAQPQTFYNGSPSSAAGATEVTGGVEGNDALGTERLWFGDNGVVDTATHNLKFKAGYDLGEWSALLNLALEDRESDTEPNSYLRDDSGNTIWGGVVSQNGSTINVPASRLGVSTQERRSISAGLRMRGPLTDNLELETNLSRFDIRRDLSATSARNPADPAYTRAGQVTDLGDSGWLSAEAKTYWHTEWVDGLTLISGLRYDTFELSTALYDSNDHTRASRDALTDRSGGQTTITAAFVQANYDVSERWDVGVGGRLERFRSHDGYYADTDPDDGLVDVAVPSQSRTDFSPKFSLGYIPADNWRLRYNVARAYRYPIVEELFSQFQAYNTVSEANPTLKPEAGVHHNLMVERAIPLGFVRVNLFSETVRDVIEAQSETLPGGITVRTFIPIDEVRTHGAEFIANASGLLLSDLDLRFNTTFTDSEIRRNRVDPSIEGNAYPRMPRWRANLMATYHLQQYWNVALNYQYASNSYGRNDNRDQERRVMGAQDGYSRVGLKTSYQLANGLSFGAGVDNLTDERSFVAHPWPGRTFYLNLSFSG